MRRHPTKWFVRKSYQFTYVLIPFVWVIEELETYRKALAWADRVNAQIYLHTPILLEHRHRV